MSMGDMADHFDGYNWDDDDLEETMTTPKQTEELLPCPFCGNIEIGEAYCGGEFWRRCGKCGASTGASSNPEIAIKYWNTRHPDPALAQTRAMLVEAYKLLDASRALIMALHADRFRFVEEKKVQGLLEKISEWTSAHVFKEPLPSTPPAPCERKLTINEKQSIQRAHLSSVKIVGRNEVIEQCQEAIHKALPNPPREGEWDVHRAWMERGIEVLERLKSPSQKRR